MKKKLVVKKKSVAKKRALKHPVVKSQHSYLGTVGGYVISALVLIIGFGLLVVGHR